MGNSKVGHCTSVGKVTSVKKGNPAQFFDVFPLFKYESIRKLNFASWHSISTPSCSSRVCYFPQDVKCRAEEHGALRVLIRQLRYGICAILHRLLRRSLALRYSTPTFSPEAAPLHSCTSGIAFNMCVRERWLPVADIKMVSEVNEGAATRDTGLGWQIFCLLH